ncbi:NAD P-binding protein [Lentinula edodes]|uniref:NAD P-binding protein n=1 Tax=Lentinula edodes TaxID=5353 RepID=A0A1Q3ESQ3_LENED|nr:NAD P-binding protein [Lentinula edodes]
MYNSNRIWLALERCQIYTNFDLTITDYPSLSSNRLQPLITAMKILIFGASGFIGFPAAQALIRAGHIVYGQTRSRENVQRFEAEEIIPIVCEPESNAWHSLLPTLDVVIEALGGTAIKQFVAASIREGVASAAQQFRPSHAPKLTYIYTSGCWVHGDNRSEIVTDTTPITSPVELVAWRPEQEQAVLTHTTLNGIVQAKEEGKVTWPGTPGGKLSVIHADDLADLYVRLTEKASIVGGKIFDGLRVNTSTGIRQTYSRLPWAPPC